MCVGVFCYDVLYCVGETGKKKKGGREREKGVRTVSRGPEYQLLVSAHT